MVSPIKAKLLLDMTGGNLFGGAGGKAGGKGGLLSGAGDILGALGGMGKSLKTILRTVVKLGAVATIISLAVKPLIGPLTMIMQMLDLIFYIFFKPIGQLFMALFKPVLIALLQFLKNIEGSGGFMGWLTGRDAQPQYDAEGNLQERTWVNSIGDILGTTIDLFASALLTPIGGLINLISGIFTGSTLGSWVSSLFGNDVYIGKNGQMMTFNPQDSFMASKNGFEGMGGGSTQNITINVSALDAGSISRSVAQSLAQQVAQVMKSQQTGRRTYNFSL